MFARLTTVRVGPTERATAGDVIDSILPTLKELEGFNGLLVLADEETRVVHSVTLWESAEAMEGSEPTARMIREAETKSRDVIGQDVNTFRVVAFHLNQP